MDESVTDVLAELIKTSSSAISVECVRELPIRGISDKGVIDYARKESRITVTTETAMNHKSFPVCSHPGIIVLSGRHRHEAAQADIFKRFLLSGHRKSAQDAVTFINEKEVRIKSHAGESSFVL